MKERLILVRSSRRIYGPFRSADHAIEWVESARRHLPTISLPLSIEVADEPIEYESMPIYKSQAKGDQFGGH